MGFPILTSDVLLNQKPIKQTSHDNRRLLIAAEFHFLYTQKKKAVKNITSWHKTLSASAIEVTRTLLVALSLACLEMSFVVNGADAVILLFRLEYKTSVLCHNVNTQKVKIARRDRSHILASNRCETFENLPHIDIDPLRSTLSGILHSKNWTMVFIGIRGRWLCQYKYT